MNKVILDNINRRSEDAKKRGMKRYKVFKGNEVVMTFTTDTFPEIVQRSLSKGWKIVEMRE